MAASSLPGRERLKPTAGPGLASGLRPASRSAGPRAALCPHQLPGPGEPLSLSNSAPTGAHCEEVAQMPATSCQRGCGASFLGLRGPFSWGHREQETMGWHPEDIKGQNSSEASEVEASSRDSVTPVQGVSTQRGTAVSGRSRASQCLALGGSRGPTLQHPQAFPLLPGPVTFYSRDSEVACLRTRLLHSSSHQHS